MAAVTAISSNILNIVTHHLYFFSNKNKYQVCGILDFMSLEMQKSCKKIGRLIISIYFNGLTRFRDG